MALLTLLRISGTRCTRAEALILIWTKRRPSSAPPDQSRAPEETMQNSIDGLAQDPTNHVWTAQPRAWFETRIGYPRSLCGLLVFKSIRGAECCGITWHTNLRIEASAATRTPPHITPLIGSRQTGGTEGPECAATHHVKRSCRQ